MNCQPSDAGNIRDASNRDDIMHDLSKLSDETSRKIMDIVEELQPATVDQVQAELARRHDMDVEPDPLVRYMEWLRSSFPRKLAHAGPDAWALIDLT